MEKTVVTDFTTGSVTKKMLLFAFPLFLSGLLQVVYNMLDMIIVGRYVGGGALSAVSIGGDVLSVLSFAAMGISGAGQIIIAQYIGAGEREKVSNLIGTLFTVLLGISLVVMILCLGIRTQILSWVNTPPEVWDHAGAYVTTCMLGLPFIYGYNLVSAILRGMGDSKRPLVFVAIASVINLILDLIFVAALGMEVFGAALATVIGQGFSFLCALAVLFWERKAIGFDFHPSRFIPDREVLIPLLKLGIPMMVQSASIMFSKLFVNSWINSYGYIASAVTGIGTKLDTVSNTLATACKTAAGTMIAQNIGAGKQNKVPEIMWVSLAVSSLIIVPWALAVVLFPATVFGLFCEEAPILEMAMTYVPVYMVLCAGSLLRVPSFGLINGSGNASLNLAVALLDGIVMRIGFALFLGLVCGMGVYGFWYGNAVSGFVPAVVGGAFLLSGKWKDQAPQK